jgi:hypothetical protein
LADLPPAAGRRSGKIQQFERILRRRIFEDPVPTRVLAIAIVAAAALPAAASPRPASPQAVACHDYATKKYIADFRQSGSRRIAYDGRGLNVVMVFENENPKYEDYFAACMKQDDGDKVR